MTYEISTDEIRSYLPKLRAGDRVLLSGRIYTSRDAAHKRICQALDNGSPLPYDLCDAIIYYAGPTPARPGMAVGSCGPTTAGRMDRYAPQLLDLGLAAMIGKGGLGEFVYQGTTSNNNTLILLGAIPAAILAIVFGAVIDLLQKKVTPKGLRKEAAK